MLHLKTPSWNSTCITLTLPHPLLESHVEPSSLCVTTTLTWKLFASFYCSTFPYPTYMCPLPWDDFPSPSHIPPTALWSTLSQQKHLQTPLPYQITAVTSWQSCRHLRKVPNSHLYVLGRMCLSGCMCLFWVGALWRHVSSVSVLTLLLLCFS